MATLKKGATLLDAKKIIIPMKGAEVIAYLQSRGRDDLLPTEKDSAHGWASRCLNILKAECLAVKSNWRGINPATEKIKSFVFDRYGKKQDDFYEPGVE